MENSKMLGELNLLTASDKNKLLKEFNNTQKDYPSSKILIELFREQVEKRPDKECLICENEHFSFVRLDEESNRFANYLRNDLNIQKGDLIGIMLDRDQWMIIATLGVLKCGAAYVPLSIDCPKERLDYIQKDMNNEKVIDGNTVVQFTNKREFLQPYFNIVSGASDELACVFYTSGSTGKPKGVMVEQRNIIRLVKSQNYFDFSPADVILSTGNFTFDAINFELWGTLLNGGMMILNPTDDLLDSHSLHEKIKHLSVTVAFFTTGWFNELVDTNVKIFDSIKTILVGGEKLSVKHVSKLKEHNKKIEFVHVYGPTENATFSTYFKIDDVHENIPIGYPISNSTCYILDESLKLLPVGMKGEIFLGGEGVTRGYLNQPELTASKYISNPYVTGELIYRTGDIGKWSGSGTIEFIGRNDNQVKIRGFRVELGEIENALLSYPGMKSVKVMTKVNVDNQKEIVTCFTAEKQIYIPDLREFMKNKIPGYMIPSNCLQVEDFPLTENGKVDTNMLLKFSTEYRNTEKANYVAPRNEIEAKLVEIWEEILGKSPIGIYDRFQDIGGHSLKAIRMISHVNKAFGLKYDLKGLYTESTIELMAERIKMDLWFLDSEKSKDENFKEIKI